MRLTQLYSGDINSNTTVNLSSSASSFTWLLVIAGQDSANGVEGFIVQKGKGSPLSVCVLETNYGLTVYQRIITITDSQIATGVGYYWRTTGLGTGNYFHIWKVYGLA